MVGLARTPEWGFTRRRGEAETGDRGRWPFGRLRAGRSLLGLRPATSTLRSVGWKRFYFFCGLCVLLRQEDWRRFGVEASPFIPHPSSLILHPFPSPFSLCGSAAQVSEANGREASWSALRAVLCSWFLVLRFYFFCALCALSRQEDWREFEVLLGLRPATSTLRSVGLECCASSIAISIAIAIGRVDMPPVTGAGWSRCFAASIIRGHPRYPQSIHWPIQIEPETETPSRRRRDAAPYPF